MKATGIVRKIDELGRVVIPMELRKTLKINNGDPLEIFTSEGEIIFRKYSMLKTLEDFAEKHSMALKNTLKDVEVIIVDNSEVITSTEHGKLKGLKLNITDELKNIIDNGLTFVPDKKLINLFEKDSNKYKGQIISPILDNGYSIGAVIVYSKKSKLKSEYVSTTNLAALFLSNHLLA